MGGSTGAAGASGASAGPAGGVGPPVSAMNSGMNPQMQQFMTTAGPLLMRSANDPNAKQQIVDQLARMGPPPTIQPYQGQEGIQRAPAVGQALTPPAQQGVLPAPRRLPMMRGESLTNIKTGFANQPGVGAALGGY